MPGIVNWYLLAANLFAYASVLLIVIGSIDFGKYASCKMLSFCFTFISVKGNNVFTC